MNPGFLLGATGLVVFALALVVVLPRLWRRDIRGETAIDWLRLRRQELQADPAIDAESLLLEAEMRVVEELADGDGEEDAAARVASQPVSRPGLVGFVLLAVVAIVPFLLYRQVGSLEDVRISEAIEQLPKSGPEAVEGVIADIEARVLQRPENSDYLSILGQFYTGAERYEDALRTYEQLLELFPESPEVLAKAAQAEYLANDRGLTPTARLRAESALAAEPNQRTALGTLGMAAFEAEDFSAALGYWERLIAFETPGTPGYQMMAAVIAEARARGGVAAPAEASGIGVTVGVTVTVQLPEGEPAPPPEATVFVIGRPAGSTQRMPTAVARLPASAFPLTVRLDDTVSMAGQTLSTLDAVDVEVQVSLSGQPGREGADWLAEVAGVIPSESAEVSVVLRPQSQ